MKEPFEVSQIVRKKVRELIDETDAQWAYERRKAHLTDVMTSLVYNSFILLARYEQAVASANLTAMTFLRERAEEEVKKIVKHLNELYYTKPEREKKPDRRAITDDMIERARQFPYNELLPVVRGMAVCPFHGDKNPSFSVKNNFGYCFGCQWKGDPIRFVMEQEGIPFVEAVKRLQ